MAANYTPQTWAQALLAKINAPVTRANLQAVVGWVNAEGGNWHNDARFNPLNTTMPAPGAGNTGTQGNIKQYASWAQGLDATARTLENGLYGGIIHALKVGNNPNAVGAAITASPWGTGGLAAKVIAQTKIGSVPSVPSVPSVSKIPKTVTTGAPTVPTVDPAARGAAVRSFLFDKGVSPLDFAGQIKALQVPAVPTVTAPPTVQPTRPTVTPTPASGTGGYVNPFGSSLKAPGRIDEGVDPTIQGAIKAVGDAKVVNISHNFYKGQPYVVYQLTSGVHAGKYIYVSELITPTVRVGQTVRAGQQIAVGHGAIETGWAGGPSGGYMPLANRAQGGNYTEGKVTGPGQSFARFLASLGAKASP